MIPFFETGRLVLRGITEGDAAAYTRHFVDYDIIGTMSRVVPWPYPEGGVLSYIRNEVLPRQGKDQWVWGIFLKSNPDELVGAITLRQHGTPGQRGFWLGKQYWGQGIMTEAVKPVMDYAFGELGFKSLQFAHAVQNVRSRRVKEKTGAVLVRHELAEYVNPEYREREVWELTRERWLEKRKAEMLAD